MGAVWSFVSSSPSPPGHLIVTALSTGIPGFPEGKPLSFFAVPGETVAAVVTRLNKYRGPDHQIAALRDGKGESLPFFTVIEGDVLAFL